jgi:uroporphyrinogen-III decarboxylase
MEMAEHPERLISLMNKTASHYGVDGLRLFFPRAAYKIKEEGETMVVYDKDTEERIGIIDVLGGGGVKFDTLVNPVEKEEDLDAIPVPRVEDIVNSPAAVMLKEGVEKAHKGGFFVASAPPGFTVNYLSDRRGRERALTDVMDNPELSKLIMDRGLEVSKAYAHALVEIGVDALYIGDPSSSCSLISPAQFREFCLPRFTEFCSELHEKDILIYIHICGNSSPLLEMLADTGTDCVEPLDPMGGVSVADAKKRVGKRVALMGGVDTVSLLNGSPEEVRNESEKCIAQGGPDGYILAAGDMVPDFAPEENVQAMIAAARESKGSI